MNDSKQNDQNTGDEILKRMLKTPPKPHGSEEAKDVGNRTDKIKRREEDASDDE